MRTKNALLWIGAGLFVTTPALAEKPVKVTVTHISPDGAGKPVGTIVFREAKDGLTMQAKLKGLPPGEHGFHLHENPSCDPGEKDGVKGAGLAAGSHYDPASTKAHKGPGGGGHKGDLPKLEVAKNGNFRGRFKLEGLTLADVKGRSIMIHEGGDNYSDEPKPLGGGGARIACGVIAGETAMNNMAKKAAPVENKPPAEGVKPAKTEEKPTPAEEKKPAP